MNVQKIEGVYKMSGAVYVSMLMIGFGSKALTELSRSAAETSGKDGAKVGWSG